MHKFFSKPVLIGFALLTVAALFLPQNFVILAPGPTTSLLGDAVQITNSTPNLKNAADFKDGALFSTAILTSAPNQRPLGYEVLQAWADGDLAVMPRNALYDAKEKPAAAKARQHQEMVDSQGAAALAALNFISKIPAYSKQTWRAEDVRIDLKNVGGGSAGLAFALALIGKTADPNLIAGRKIAATGTIAQNGKVGEIGGVDQKIIGAQKSGVKIFLMPKASCPSLSKHPKGLTIYAVSTLTEAVHALAGANASSFGCPKE